MLKLLRKHTKIIIWAVILSFALWGGYSVGTQLRKGSRYAGEVFGKGVTYKEFDFFYRASQIFTFSDKAVEDPEILKQITWQNIIYSREAKARKITVSDEEVRQRVVEILKAQGIENPSTEFYQNWLRKSLRETPRDFEEKVREFARIRKLIQLSLKQPTPPSDEELNKEFLLDSKAIAFEAVRFPTFDEAKNFHDKAKTWEGWNRETNTISDKLVRSAPVSLRQVSALSGISASDALKLFELDRNQVCEPMPSHQGHMLFIISNKQEMPQEDFEQWKSKYLDTLAQREFMIWATDLRNRAKLKEFLPASETEES